MRTRVRNPFTTVQTSGLLLPVDLLARIVDGDPSLPGLTPDSYHLNAGERLNEAAARAWNTCVGNWKAFREASRKVPASDQGTTLTRDKWLLPLFRELGYGWLQANKRSLEIDDKPYPVSHQWQSHVPVHLVSFKFDVDRRTPGATGAAQRSPYSLVQEFLNRSAQHRWGFVSNGHKLVVLHDNVSLVRASNVEFDLEAMFDGEVYSDFVLLFALCHQSRVEILAEDRPEECWLERWSKLAEEQGTRAREKLRVGVERAIQALGTGFRIARGNTALNEALRTETLDTQEFYRELLRMVYRILLLLVAEDKRLGDEQNLLHPPDSTPEAHRRYAQYYSLGRLRKLASLRRGTAHSDLYESLKVLFAKLRAGYAPLAIPGLGSFLFSPETTPHLDSASLSNEHLLEAIRHLCYTEDVSGRGGSLLRPVDFGNLGSEELGSVYESLLELHPRIDTDAGPFILAVAAGHERKTTGSYYTPTSLINCLLDSALDPVVLEALAKSNPEEALLNLKICDPACGSGHFLIAAAERMAKHLARLRTGDDEPSLSAIQQAKRAVIGRCVYGVDLNPMAAELCKVSLWMEALEPGKPLSFLDHHIQIGNSLLGATPALLHHGIPDEVFEPIEGDNKAVCKEYRKRNRDERRGQGTMFDRFEAPPWRRLGNFAEAMLRLDTLADDTLDGIRDKENRYAEWVASSGYESGRLLADAWCAAFVWEKVRPIQHESFLEPITEGTFRLIEENPHKVPDCIRKQVCRLANGYRFFHWHLKFPNVFRPSQQIADDEMLGWSGGFDVVLGNPPWERIKIQEKEWFAERLPEVADAPSASARRRMIEALEQDHPFLFQAFIDDLRRAEAESHFVRNSGRFPRCGKGDINTYSIFAELNRHLVSPTGRVGCILPSGIATDETTKEFFSGILKERFLASLLDFENRENYFPRIGHGRMKFTLLPLGHEDVGSFAFQIWNTSQIQDKERTIKLDYQSIAKFNPNSLTCPIFRTSRDARIAHEVYGRFPVLMLDKPESNPWHITFSSMFHMTHDSHLFLTKDVLQSMGCTLEGNIFSHPTKGHYLPLYEAKMANHYDHRFGTYAGRASSRQSTTLDTPSIADYQDPSFAVLPRYWVSGREVPENRWNLGYRDITHSTNDRTFIAHVLPRAALGNSIFCIDSEARSRLGLLLANLCSFAFDYQARMKVGGLHLNFFVVKQLPLLPPEKYETETPWRRDAILRDWVTPRVLELTYTARDIDGFAVDCGYSGSPFRWDEDRRFLLRCELDAAFFHLYGLNRDDTDYIMETFPVVKKKDIQQHGNYRTKLTILEIYDAMQRAIETGEPYQTLLDPPPADPRVAHPPREGVQ